MSDVYTRFYKMAVRRLGLSSADGGNTQGLGKPLVLNKKLDNSEVDPATGIVTNPASRYEGSGLRISFKQYHIDNQFIMEGDVNFYISSVTSSGATMPKPVTGDTIEFLSESWVVVDTAPWDFNGLALGYKAHARVAN